MHGPSKVTILSRRAGCFRCFDALGLFPKVTYAQPSETGTLGTALLRNDMSRGNQRRYLVAWLTATLSEIRAPTPPSQGATFVPRPGNLSPTALNSERSLWCGHGQDATSSWFIVGQQVDQKGGWHRRRRQYERHRRGTTTPTRRHRRDERPIERDDRWAAEDVLGRFWRRINVRHTSGRERRIGQVKRVRCCRCKNCVAVVSVCNETLSKRCWNCRRTGMISDWRAWC